MGVTQGTLLEPIEYMIIRFYLYCSLRLFSLRSVLRGVVGEA